MTMDRQLDNIKMWESILTQINKSPYDTVHVYHIHNALKEQGFKWDGEHIVPIPKPLKIEKGKWYMCIKQFLNCIEGRLYTSINDGRIIDDFGTESDMHSDACEYFRLATEEEIKGNNGGISPKLASEYNKHYKHRYEKNDLLLSANRERMYVVEGWDYNERNIPIYNMRQIGARTIFDWMCEKADKELMPLNIKIGDWVVYQNEAFQIVKSSYSLILQGEHYQTHFLYPYCRSWTIGDAKDGDVLVNNDASYIVLFKRFSYSEDGIDRFKSYCHCREGVFSSIEDTGWCCNGFYPATKEQRDTLFAKMKEAGYKWDAENKQLVANSAEPSDGDKELTEFEKAVGDACIRYSCAKDGYFNDIIKSVSKELLSIARKQIASEIDKEDVYEQCYTTDILRMSQANAYMKGIEDTLNKIKVE